MATTVTPIPPLDRNSPTFRTETNLYFGTRIPTFTTEINEVADELMDARDETVAARDESVPLANQVITLAPQAIAASMTVQTLAPQVAANAAQVQADKAQVATMVAGATQVQMGGSTGYPTIGPSLICNFAHAQRLSRKLTFTRAGAATYLDQLGRLRTAASGMPVFEFDVAGRSLGYRSEPSRTNLILNSATMATQSAAVTAQVYTLSFIGTGTVTRSGVSTGALVGTGAANRVSVSFTPTAGSLTMTVSGSVTNAQLEAGSSATSYIATTGSAVTRPADILTLPAAAAADLLNPAQGTFVVEFTLNDVPGSGVFGNVFSYRTADNSERISAFITSGALTIHMVRATTIDVCNVTMAPPGGFLVGQRYRFSVSYSSAGLTVSLNGAALVSSAITGVMPNITSGLLDICHRASSNFLNGHIAQLYPFPRLLTDAELIAASRL